MKASGGQLDDRRTERTQVYDLNDSSTYSAKGPLPGT